MERVLGIGGIFFKAKAPAKLAAWYQQHLGVAIEAFGGAKFGPTGDTIWSAFPEDADHLGSGTLMINYRVASRDRMLAQLRAAGVSVDEKTDDSAFGKFGWATDPEGNRFEIWEPPAK